jgi:hypothetical protein
MVLFPIGYPDQEINKTLCAFAPWRFNSLYPLIFMAGCIFRKDSTNVTLIK